jgi:hypothetical protein
MGQKQFKEKCWEFENYWKTLIPKQIPNKIKRNIARTIALKLLLTKDKR